MCPRGNKVVFELVAGCAESLATAPRTYLTRQNNVYVMNLFVGEHGNDGDLKGFGRRATGICGEYSVSGGALAPRAWGRLVICVEDLLCCVPRWILELVRERLVARDDGEDCGGWGRRVDVPRRVTRITAGRYEYEGDDRQQNIRWKEWGPGD